MKYIGVIIVSSRNFKISTKESRRAFHHAAKLLMHIWLHRQNCYTEEVVLQLLPFSVNKNEYIAA